MSGLLFLKMSYIHSKINVVQGGLQTDENVKRIQEVINAERRRTIDQVASSRVDNDVLEYSPTHFIQKSQNETQRAFRLLTNVQKPNRKIV